MGLLSASSPLAIYGPLNDWAVGIARLPVELAVQGTPLIMRNSGGEIPAIANEMPFHDPDKKRRNAKG